MDLEDQGRIKELAEEYGKDGIVVLLGAPTTESSQVQFETVTTGDPSYAGPLPASSSASRPTTSSSPT